MHYILEVPRYTNIVYIGVCLVLTYIDRLVSTVCYFLSYFCWSVNCMSQVSKFHKVFPTGSETLYLRTFSIVIYGKFIFIFPVLF